MRGRDINKFTFDRVLADIRDARGHCARAIFIVDDNLTLNGTTSVVACENLSGDEIEYLRWKAERWIKARHWVELVKHGPIFMARNIEPIFDFKFRGSTLKTFLRLEDDRRAFERNRGIQAAERTYV
jgi:hypothetical protein